MKIKAIIFDMDGVLIDSQPWHFEAERKTMESYGHKITDEELKQYMGWNEEAFWTALKEKYNIEDSVEKIEKRKQPIYMDILSKNLKPDLKLKKILQKLKNKGLGLAVASSSNREWIELVLKCLEITNLIDQSVAGNEIQRSKPNPDIFLEAASKLGLGIEPKYCMVIEDAPSGVQAAKAGGMFVAALIGEINKNLYFSNADFIIRGLNEIFDIIDANKYNKSSL